MPYYETYPGSGRLKLPLQLSDSNTHHDRHLRSVESQQHARQTALAEDHRRFPNHHDILPCRACPDCSGEPHGYEEPPQLIVVIDGWYLESLNDIDEWGLYKLAADGQPNPWTNVPRTRIDYCLSNVRGEGEQAVLMVLQHALEFLTAEPANRYPHYEALTERVAYPAEVIAQIRAHSSVLSNPSR